MAKKQTFIEQREKGDYAVRRAGSKRASDVAPTQKKAIAKARKLEPGTKPVVERVRNTKTGGRDQWRKP